jgi:hypothetical protein
MTKIRKKKIGAMKENSTIAEPLSSPPSRGARPLRQARPFTRRNEWPAGAVSDMEKAAGSREFPEKFSRTGGVFARAN